MRSRTGLLAIAASLATAVTAFAQTTPPAAPAQAQPATVRTVEFDAAIQQAVDKNPTVAQAATAVTRAEALLQQARAATLPAINASVSNVTISGAQEFNGVKTQPSNQLTVTGDFSVPILEAARWAAVNQSREQIDVQKLSVAEVRQQVAVSAAQAYLAVFAAKRQVDVEQRALDNANAHLNYAQQRLDAGVGSRVNQLRAAQESSSELARLENTRLSLLMAQEALGVLLAEDGPVDTGAEPAFDVPASLSEADWIAARPDLRFDQAAIAAAQHVVTDSTKDWWPTVTGAFDPQYINPANLFTPSRSWRLTFTLQQPIFDGGARRAAKALRQVSVTQDQLTFDLHKIQARSDVRLSAASVASYQRALANARTAVDQANEVLQITTQAFQVGATTNLDVIDAERTARDAGTVATQAEDSVRRARLQLLVALGRFPK
jgi:outer membrane protein TolC